MLYSYTRLYIQQNGKLPVKFNKNKKLNKLHVRWTTQCDENMAAAESIGDK